MARLDRAQLEHSTLIVAHPDDEVLWFGSIVQHVGKIIMAFQEYAAVPGLGQRRAAAIAELPYRNLACLGIPEAGSLHRADWADPAISEFGLAFGASAAGNEAAARYEANFRALRAALRPELHPDMTVFTHNPWGEYGHEDHVQVFRVLEGLRREVGFQMWVPTYCSNRSAAFAARYGLAPDSNVVTLPIDRIQANRIADTYRKHDCWTWANDTDWLSEECFVSLPLSCAGDAPDRHPVPLTFVASEP